MKSLSVFVAVLVGIMYSAHSYADDAQLMLDKIRLSFNVSLGDSACDELMYVEGGKDIPDMRDFPCYARTGKYTMTLSGPPGTTVTLFGYFNFGKQRGYLVVKKKDAQPVWILDLEDFPKEKWVTVPAKGKSGAYEVFSHYAPIFSQNVSSIRWGKWWTGDQPL